MGHGQSHGLFPHVLSLLVAAAFLPSSAPALLSIGDTLTVIQRPLLNIPAIMTPGDTLPISCEADPGTTGWAAELVYGSLTVPLAVVSSSYDASTLWWTVKAVVPPVDLYELYDLRVTAAVGIDDVSWNAVNVIPAFEDDWYFIHLTDTHMPTHLYYYENGAETDTSELVDFREVMNDAAIIHPEFVLITGDFINEGELEEYLSKRYYTRTQKALAESEVPTYLTSGNHDLGGWDETPPPDGTARRDWWRFFGWKRLDSPPAGAPWYTQNYSFDYGPVHFVGLEAYINYDDWRPGIYGADSFTPGQMQWLADDLAAAPGGSAKVLFYHRDFSGQIDLNSLGAILALSGHTHSDNGSVGGSGPWDLTTDNVCDGARSYRLIRVSGGAIQPTATMSAGGSGQNLRVAYSPSNDGTAESVTALITNNQSQRFQNGRIRFFMPAGAASYDVTGGTLAQVDDSEGIAVCYVDVDIDPSSSQSVTVTADMTSANVASGAPVAGKIALSAARPNPFNPSTILGFELAEMSDVRLSVYDVRGREIALLAAGIFEAGGHSARWGGTDASGDSMPSGVYFVRLRAGGESLARKVLLAR
ncbi:MAG: metallophosphoesterase [Candidatus Eisenbacteria bacterium]